MGGVLNLIEKVHGHDQDISVQFANGWNKRAVEYGGISIKIIEEIISQVTLLSLDGVKFFSKCVDKNFEANKFLDEGKNLEYVTAGIKISSIPEPFAEISQMIV
ncbi:hypothetical protein KI387_009963, partial [Taxus chinensis]